jgi:hypothetical protein
MALRGEFDWTQVVAAKREILAAVVSIFARMVVLVMISS